ncbi:hypothetical protein CCZ01_09010 [Helicobacter monodelphidis]|uniref:glycosyltransferase family 4 protein n=1 Tax=Helicobacter sp. 15-1451 TaxID=2004995 RepID=UPI000DCE3970|nr:MraY family glycosyltransferase [Helicobacter sp. 15-1451]RAX56608.1 hypothetical protein CCZ01_09010 [Helicobacter sp. 15-1451]
MLIIESNFWVICLSAFCFSLFLQGVSLLLSNHYRIFIDKAETLKPQRVHQHDAPRGGGIGISLGLAFIIFIPYYYDEIQENIVLFYIAILLAFLSGFLEDIYGNISPHIRLVMQSMAVCLGIYALKALLLDIGFYFFTLPLFIAIPFSVFCVVGVVNAMNIIDGFHGLSAGIGMLVLGHIFYLAYQYQDVLVYTISAIAIMAILGFFIINFPKGYIFLGDGGAYAIGFVIAFLLILLTQRHHNISVWFGLAVMIYPVFEVLFSIYRKKYLLKISPFTPDNRHLHSLLFYCYIHNSALTTFAIVMIVLPFIAHATYFAHSTIMLCLNVFIFIILYITAYFFLYNKIHKI